MSIDEGLSGEFIVYFVGKTFQPLFCVSGCDTASVCDCSDGSDATNEDLRNHSFRTVTIWGDVFLGTDTVNLYMPPWKEGWHSESTTAQDAYNRGTATPLRSGEKISFSIGPSGINGSSWAPNDWGRCNFGAIEVESDGSGIVTGFYGVTAGGSW
jgi:hypothetical protein